MDVGEGELEKRKKQKICDHDSRFFRLRWSLEMD
jgi:hypothetical protein